MMMRPTKTASPSITSAEETPSTIIIPKESASTTDAIKAKLRAWHSKVRSAKTGGGVVSPPSSPVATSEQPKEFNDDLERVSFTGPLSLSEILKRKKCNTIPSGKRSKVASPSSGCGPENEVCIIGEDKTVEKIDFFKPTPSIAISSFTKISQIDSEVLSATSIASRPPPKNNSNTPRPKNSSNPHPDTQSTELVLPSEPPATLSGASPQGSTKLCSETPPRKSGLGASAVVESTEEMCVVPIELSIEVAPSRNNYESPPQLPPVTDDAASPVLPSPKVEESGIHQEIVAFPSISTNAAEEEQPQMDDDKVDTLDMAGAKRILRQSIISMEETLGGDLPSNDSIGLTKNKKMEILKTTLSELLQTMGKISTSDQS